ncbi:MAG: DUF5654 family protein [archaeon]
MGMKKQKQFTKKEQKKKFRQEFKKTIGTGIITAFGLIIALVWKDAITEYFNSLVELSPLKGRLISAVIITLFSAIGILIITKIISVEKK